MKIIKYLITIIGISISQTSSAQLEPSSNKTNYPKQPYLIFNFKNSDCQNCSIIAYNKLNQIKTKSKIVVVFEDSTLENIFYKVKHNNSGCLLYFDSLFSKAISIGNHNSFSIVTNNKVTNYYINEISDSLIKYINNDLLNPLKQSEFDYKNSNLKSINLKSIKNESLFLVNNSFGIMDYTNQYCTIYEDTFKSVIPTLNNSTYKEMRNIFTRNSPNQLTDSLHDILISQTGFSKYLVKNISFFNEICLGLTINMLTQKKSTDSSLNLAMQGYTLIASGHKGKNNELLNIDSYNKYYPLVNIEKQDKKMYPTLTYGFVKNNETIYCPYIEYIDTTSTLKLVAQKFDSNKAEVISVYNLNFWEKHKDERIIFKLDSLYNPYILYLNSKIIETPASNQLVELNKGNINEKSVELIDFKIITNNTVKVLLISNGVIYESTIDLKTSKVLNTEIICYSNLNIAKYFKNNIYSLNQFNNDLIIQRVRK